MKLQVGQQIKVLKQIPGEYVVPGEVITAKSIQTRTVWFQGEKGSSFIATSTLNLALKRGLITLL